MALSDNITNIKGIGDKTALLFAKIGVYTVSDLIHTYPRNYLTYDDPIDINSVREGERCAICATISSYADIKQVRNLKITSVLVKDMTGTLRMTWFNSPYLKSVFHKGDTYIFVGTVKVKNNVRVMEMPEYYRPNVYSNMKKVMQPIYPLTSGLSNKIVTKTVTAIRNDIYNLSDYLDEKIIKENNLMPLNEAYDSIHFPKDEETLKRAINRLAFDEFYRFLSDMSSLRHDNNLLTNSHVIVQGKTVADFVSDLPFQLTKGQAGAIDDILLDMGSKNVMNRLVQGDVGSGKTIVACASLLACAKEGYQGALMVPTEVLAKQHYAELSERLLPYGIRVDILVGSTTLKEKRRIYEELKEGNIDILIGTHALIEDKVVFKDLALVVTDEQHRFGVNQRKRLFDKGNSPHVLVMSATPIPRTLAIIMYADLDISVISELPKGRKPIKNCVVGTNYRKTAYNFISKEVAEGSQVYIICPMVEESETLDVANVTDYTETIKMALGPTVNVKMLHGQMKADEKNSIMEEFMNGEIQVLISTTVIEVGINNPNATVMMVENAERFGLAQLHQLRGRVGRGKKQSYCIFINGKESDESMERLKVLENSNDGFFIANEDLRLRGPGDFFGIRQSGEVLFKLADIYNHTEMLKLAQEVCMEYGNNLYENSFENETRNNMEITKTPTL